MPSSVFKSMRIVGIAGAVPTTTVYNRSFIGQLEESVVNKVIQVTGIEQVQRACRRQTASDLGVAAAEMLIKDKKIDRSEIGAIIDVTEFPDYVAPSTAFTIHKRLGLSQSCMAFDVNLGCTGYVYGLHIACALLHAMSQKYVLLIVGDVPKNNDFSNRKNPDHSYLMMFGDAGTATLIEKTEDIKDEIVTDLYADASDFKKLYTLGGARCVDAPHDVTTWSDGIDRSLYDSYMDGMGVFAFSTKVAPKCMKEFLKRRNETLEDYHDFYFHQANKMIVDRIAKLMKISSDKVPMSLQKYGNTNCGTIPVTLVEHLGSNQDVEEQKVLLCGYGVGLSWGIVSLKIRPADVYPMLYTDYYWEEGEVKPR